MKSLTRLTITFFSFLILTMAAGSASAAGGESPACFTCMDIEDPCDTEHMQAACDLGCSRLKAQGCWDLDPEIEYCDPDEKAVKCQDIET